MARRIFYGLGFVIIVLGITIITFIGSGIAGLKLPDKRTQIFEVQFETGQADIKGKYQDDMKKIAEIMTKDPQATAVIKGYTDNSGQTSVNLKLSKSRAESVKKYLVEALGVDAARLETIGYGPSKPIESNATAEGRQMNRRVAIIVKYEERRVLSRAVVPVTEEKTSVYSQVTGLIVDASDMVVYLAMTPNIYNESGQVIYGTAKNEMIGLTRDCVRQVGVVSYSNNLSDAQKYPRVGSNPLIVKGIKVVGEDNKDIVISDADAQKIMELEKEYHFLEKCKVSIVVGSSTR